MANVPSGVTSITARDIAFVLNKVSGGTRDNVRVDEISQMAAEHAWWFILSVLRGRIPEPVPGDLMWVSKAAGLRIAKGMVDTGSMLIKSGEVMREMEYRPWTGFMLVERLILNRYRKTVA